MFDVLIIGSGPAGLTAAIYAARANKDVALLTGPEIGGQLMKTTDVENYPGFADPITGPDLMDAMYKQAENLNVKMLKKILIRFEKVEQIFNIFTNDGEMLESKTLIIATGASPKMLGIEGSLMGRGISTCATCDGFFFKNKEVMVIGGGNSAVEEAIFLAGIASKVYVVHRREEFRAEKIMQDRMFANKKIEIIWPYEVNKFVGTANLETIELKHSKTSALKNLAVSGAFIAIGHTPNTSFLKGILDLHESGYVKDGPKTKIDGLFVAGDVCDSKYRQAVTSAGFGCIAALEAIRFLEMQES